MTNVLYLPHRLPYPPNKGDKVRSFNFLKHLSKRHQVFVASFIDDPADQEHLSTFKEYCAESFIRPQNPLMRRLFSATALLSGQALGVTYYRDQKLQAWIDQIIKRANIDRILIYSSTMSQFVDQPRYVDKFRVADFCDVDSDKWRQYALKSSWPMQAVFNREASTLLKYEREIASRFDATVFVTKEESELFKRLAPESANKITHVDNGVDTSYFDPEAVTSDVTQESLSFVFTGAMDYRANVDAVVWFVDMVWPIILATLPSARFVIVGSNPSSQVLALGEKPGVQVTGRVPDVRPYLKAAKAAVAPLRIARGTQNKVLEAMAMAKPIVCSSAAAEGLNSRAQACLQIADDPKDFAERLIALAKGDGYSKIARDTVEIDYSWESHLGRFDDIFKLN
jgi:sugar transferase (PEP-CTERM/EpsH1 system associated)